MPRTQDDAVIDEGALLHRRFDDPPGQCLTDLGKLSDLGPVQTRNSQRRVVLWFSGLPTYPQSSLITGKRRPLKRV